MLIDSNIIIYALNSSSPKCKTAQKFIEDNRNKSIFAQQNIFESIRILTHAKFPQPFSGIEAIRAVTAITHQSEIIHPNSETQEITFSLIKKYQLTGTEVFDAFLVATALTYQIKKIATDNLKHLKKYEEIAAFNPFDITYSNP